MHKIEIARSVEVNKKILGSKDHTLLCCPHSLLNEKLRFSETSVKMLL